MSGLSGTLSVVSGLIVMRWPSAGDLDLFVFHVARCRLDDRKVRSPRRSGPSMDCIASGVVSGAVRLTTSLGCFPCLLHWAVAADEHRELERLLVVEPRIDRRLVGAREIRVGEAASTAGALGDVLARELDVHAAQERAVRLVDLERQFQAGAF